MADLLDLDRLIDDATLFHAQPEIVQIRIEKKAIAGSMVVVEMFGEAAEHYRARGVKFPREVLIHPDDWQTILDSLPELTPDRDPIEVGRVNVSVDISPILVGIPVVGA